MNIAMFNYLILTQIVFFKTFLFVDGHGVCASNLHVDLESNRYYKSFMYLDSIGLLQCIKLCKRYKLCEKIHHSREQLTCELMMTYTEASNMKPLLDVQSVQIDNSTCSRDSCSEAEVCVERRDDNHICIVQGICPAADWVSFNRKCYFFSGSKMTTDEALVFCESRNSTLVRIDDTEVNSFLLSEMTKRGMEYLWLAANDRELEGEWVWGPGDVVVNALWIPGQPSNTAAEDCTVLEKNRGGWADWHCTSNAFAACEVQMDFLPL